MVTKIRLYFVEKKVLFSFFDIIYVLLTSSLRVMHHIFIHQLFMRHQPSFIIDMKKRKIFIMICLMK